MELAVLLGDVDVARLEARDDGSVALRFLDSYRQLRPRPVLGLYYLDKLRRPIPATAGLPPFFANLLPEASSPLRRLIARAAGSDRDLQLLAHLGEDLPGAVVVRPLEALPEAPPAHAEVAEVPVVANKLRFSLAGVQLKFSVLRSDKGLVLPASGRGGDWIVKLPDRVYPRVPENEYATMTWARDCGIDVPEFDLVTAAELVDIPDSRLLPEGELVFAIRRFDRPQPGVRVHMEDFAQVNGLQPADKYDEDRPLPERIGYETIANQILVFCGPAELRQYVRRLVFMVLCGNADAHLKNWTLVYPDGRTPRLSPAYDLVCTIAYHETSDQLALPFNGALAFEQVSVAGFRRLAARIGVDPDELARWVVEDTARIMDVWSATSRGLPYDDDARYRLAEHHRRLRAAPGSLLCP